MTSAELFHQQWTTLFIFVVLIIFYFMPTIFAFTIFRSDRRWKIFGMNLFLGWLPHIWFACFVASYGMRNRPILPALRRRYWR